MSDPPAAASEASWPSVTVVMPVRNEAGFIRRSVPLVVRRLVTMTPALVVLAVGLEPTRSLVISQVVLSFGIPFALVPLVMLTRRRDVMGELVNRRLTSVVAGAVAGLVIALNVFLLGQTFFG